MLYAWITPQAGVLGYDSFSLYKSMNKGCDWTQVGVTFDRAHYGISFAGFVQFGKDNGAAIDGYVYSIATAVSDASRLDIVQRPGQVMMMRVPAASIENPLAYQFFAGLDSNGQPRWLDASDVSQDPSKAVPVYEDNAGGVGPFPQMSYVPALRRFVYTNQHGVATDPLQLGFQSRLTMAQASWPWGPWTDFYHEVFSPPGLDQTLFQWNFAPKWFRDGGRSFTLIFSGSGNNDSWNTVDGTFTISP